MKNLLRVFTLLVFLSLFNKPAEASHLFGGEFTYQYLGALGNATAPFRYKVIYKTYVTCVGFGISPTVQMGFYQKNGTLIKTMTVGSTSPMTPLPLPIPGSCPIPNLPCISLKTYETTVDLPLSADGYYVTGVTNARNNGLTNISGVGGTDLFLYIDMPPQLLGGSSPVFSDNAVVVIFAGDTTSISNSAFDADGDKLIYSFNNPFGAQGSNSFNPVTNPNTPSKVGYNAGFSFAQPFGANGYASINNLTGLAQYYVPNIGNYVVSFQVKEYRNIPGVGDVLIGSTIRDIQLVVKDAPANSNTKPNFTYNGPKVISITQGQAISPISFTFTDPDAGQLLTVSASSPLLDGPGNKNATFNFIATNQTQITNLLSGATATFNFTSACSDVNSYPLDITITDNACPPRQRIESFLIQVEKGPRNFAPTDILLPVTIINENVAANTVIGNLQVSDADMCDTHNMSLISGSGSTDNAAFTLSPTGALSINNIPDFETKSNYSIRVKAIDETGLPTEKVLTLTINNVNEAPSTPTDTNSASNSVFENASNGMTTGITASSTDPESAALTYSLTNNAGGRFAIDGTSGIITVANASLLDYETATSHQITVQVTDGTLTATQNFNIAVADIDEIAPAIQITSTAGSSTAISPIPVSVTFSETITGFTVSDVVVSGGTINNFTGNGLAYTFEIIPASNGVINVNIPSGSVIDAAGNSNVAATPFSITYNSITGVIENVLTTGFNLQVYPNPSNGSFTITLNNSTQAELSVSDLAGKTIFSKALESANGQVNDLLELKTAPGIYLLQIKVAGNLITKKLILQL